MNSSKRIKALVLSDGPTLTIVERERRRRGAATSTAAARAMIHERFQQIDAESGRSAGAPRRLALVPGEPAEASTCSVCTDSGAGRVATSAGSDILVAKRVGRGRGSRGASSKGGPAC